MEFMVEVRKYGGLNQDSFGPVPIRLDEVIQALQETRLEIPPEYRSDARVEMSEERGMECMSIYYYRPRTADEIAADQAAFRANWEKQLRDAEERAKYCRLQLTSLTASSESD